VSNLFHFLSLSFLCSYYTILIGQVNRQSEIFLKIILCQNKKYSLEQIPCQIFYFFKQKILSIIILVLSPYAIRVYDERGPPDLP
jgi:hypothetical protein